MDDGIHDGGNLAIDGKLNVGDDNLLALKDYKGMRITSPAGFRTILSTLLSKNKSINSVSL